MTTNEIKAEIDRIETERFYLAMKDHWTPEDFRHDAELSEQVNRLWKWL